MVQRRYTFQQEEVVIAKESLKILKAGHKFRQALDRPISRKPHEATGGGGNPLDRLSAETGFFNIDTGSEILRHDEKEG